MQNYIDVMNTPSFKMGVNEGKEQGLQQGRLEGLKKGILQEKIRLARQLLDVLDNNMIAMKVGLAVDEIVHLRDASGEKLD